MFGVITAITLTATSDRKRINTLSSEMYTTNMIREVVTGMLDGKKASDAVIVNMTRYISSATRPEEVRLIGILDQTENGIVKRVPLGKDAEMVIKNVTNSISMTGNYNKIENNRNGEIELDLVFKLGKKIEEKYYVKGN